MDFLVTGGAGFIGSNIVNNLLEQGHSVTVIDNLTTGSSENLNKNALFINSSCGNAVKNLSKKFDGIYHLGIPSSSPIYKEKPELTGQAITEFVQLLEFQKKNEIPKMVYASSSSVYNGIEPPHSEDKPIKIKDYYTEARIAMERLSRLYHDLHGVKSIGMRFFSVYGPNEQAKKQYANCITQFLWQMQKNETPLIYGDGTQTRDFTFVNDIVHACEIAMHSKIGCDVFNVGTGKSHSFNEVIDKLNDALDKKITPKYVENPLKNYVHHTKADTKKLKKNLKFKHKHDLDKTIPKMIEYYS